jgi:hypothetical protein
MTMNNERNPKPSFWQRLGRAFANLLKFFLILVIVIGIVAAVIYGAPYLYEKFLLPIERNAARLTEVENKLTADMEILADQVTDLQTRLTEMENRQTRSAQVLAEYQGKVEVLESQIEAQGETILQLDAIQAQIDELADASARHEDLLMGDDSPLTDLQHQVTISRSIELLSRSRLYLIQSNYGMARQDIQAARDLLFALQIEMLEDKADEVQAVVARLDLALGNLPAFPVLAMNDVDIAWQSLVYGLSDQLIEMPTPAPIMPTPTPEPEDETPTPTEEEEITATATP